MTASQGDSTASKCPVKYDANADGSSAQGSFWSSLFSTSSSNSNPAAAPKDVVPDGCASSATDAVPSLEEAAKHAQTPQPDQRVKLGTERQRSSIPRVGAIDATTVVDAADAPHHQHDPNNVNWVYPSEQQLYNAMRRKGWQNIPEDSIPTVLQIHNNINERTWHQIQSWEGTEEIHLSKFQGRPRDLSPKAFLLSSVLRLYDAPFDRHDWYVQHNGETSDTTKDFWMTGQPQRYVIDYYYLNSKDNPNLPPIPYVDARPALDHPRAFVLRAQQFVKEALPGISTFLKQRSEQQQLTSTIININTPNINNTNKNYAEKGEETK